MKMRMKLRLVLAKNKFLHLLLPNKTRDCRLELHQRSESLSLVSEGSPRLPVEAVTANAHLNAHRICCYLTARRTMMKLGGMRLLPRRMFGIDDGSGRRRRGGRGDCYGECLVAP